MTTTHVGPGIQLPDSVVIELARGEQQERAEQRQREAARMDFEDRCAQAAPLVRAIQGDAMARAEVEAAQADSEVRRARQQREMQLEDLRTDLVRQGRRWRTIGEILRDAQGDPW
jgi:hypothetical protein